MAASIGDADGALDLLDLPFDQYTRHSIVQRVAEAIRREASGRVLHVLDVGGYPCLTPRFLPSDTVTVVDVVPAGGSGSSGPSDQPPPYICADGAALPFRDRSFDLVVSLDSLEHVAAEHRVAYVSELLRVSAGYVLLVAPFAQDETVLAERLLAEFIRVVNQEDQPQLREHREFGLPRMAEWLDFASERGLAHISFSSGFVYNWLPMMLLKHYVSSVPGSVELHRAIDRFYNETLQSSDRKQPGYRQGMLIAVNGPSRVLDEAASALAPAGEADRMEVVERMEQIGLLLKLADLHVASRRDDRLRDDLVAKDRHILNLERSIEQAAQDRQLLEQQVESLKGELGDVRQHLDDVRNGRAMRAMDALSQFWSAVNGEPSARQSAKKDARPAAEGAPGSENRHD